jgi:hypothetical protein
LKLQSNPRERRGPAMSSVHLNISYLNKIPYIDVDDNGTSIGGLFGEMFTLVQSKLRFRVSSPEKIS